MGCVYDNYAVEEPNQAAAEQHQQADCADNAVAGRKPSGVHNTCTGICHATQVSKVEYEQLDHTAA